MIKNTVKIMLLFCLLGSGQLMADIDIERSNLAKLVNEIDYLIKRVETIKTDAQKDQYLTFHYDILKADLLKIKTGINEHLKESLDAGKIIEPLTPHYHSYRQ